jgi:O-acetyl-ADP-ribose deacetylase (regulator of RNase III)
LGPVYGQDKPEDRLLAACYRNALRLAEEHRLSSLAFPAISTGAFGYPPREAAEVALKTMAETAPALQSVKLIRAVLFSEGDYILYKEVSAVCWPFDKEVQI